MGWDLEKVGVLDGGFVKFSFEYPEHIDATVLTDDQLYLQSPLNENYNFAPRTELVKDLEDIVNNLDTKENMVVDARPAARFLGKAPEPRPGIQSGHMPNSVSIPFTEVLTSNATLKSPEEIKKIYSDRNIDITNESGPAIISSCGSGVSAAVLDFALYSSGNILKLGHSFLPS